MPERSLQVGNVRLAYTDEGSGPIVICAHGLGRSRAADRASGLYDWPALLAAGYRLISYDARGHGESGGTAEADTYRWDALAEDLLAVIDHVSPGEPVHAIGISMGTGTILTALTRAPHRFARVVLGAPPTAWETRAEQGAQLEQLARVIETTSPERLAALFADAPVPPIFEGVAGYSRMVHPVHEMLPVVLRGARRSDLPAPERIAEIDVPALILAWDTDPVHPVSTAQRLDELLGDSVLHVSRTADDIRTWGKRAAAFFD